MKIDQINYYTTDRINDILESRFGARIDLSEENVDTLTVFQAAVKRELDEMTASIGFNKSMQNPKFVENRLVFDLIANAIKEKKGKDHDGDGDIDSDDYMAAKDKAIKKAMGKDKEVKEDAHSKDMEANLPKIMKMKKELMGKGMKSGDAMDHACDRYGFDPDDVAEYMSRKESVKEGTEMGKIGDVYIKQFAGGKDKGLSVQLTSDKGGYVQMTKDEAKQIAERLLKWATSDSMAYPGDYE